MRYVLGVDGGASKTHTLVASQDGKILAFGIGSGSNHQSVGLRRAIAEINSSVCSALSEAMISPGDIDLGCFCLAGADFPEDFSMLKKAIRSRMPLGSIKIKNDTFASLRSGLSRPYGVTVICGTGFNAAGIALDGREYALPGLGAISGDWGGGTDISSEIIRRIMRAWDGRSKKTILTRLVLDALQIDSVSLLLDRLYKGEIKQKKLLALTPLVFKAALKGDAVAESIIQTAGKEVAVSARAIIRRLDLGAVACEVILSGSIFKGKGPLLLDTIRDNIHSEFKRAEIKRPRFEPVVGALLLALEELDNDLPPNAIENIQNTIPKALVIKTENGI